MESTKLLQLQSWEDACNEAIKLIRLADAETQGDLTIAMGQYL